MNLAELSIRRPVFMTCVVILTLAAGMIAMSRLGVDLFPNVTFPVVTVTTPFPGAGPAEVETLVSRPLEEELSTLSGIKKLSSSNREGSSLVIAEFTLETDVKYAEQQIRDRVGATKGKLPEDIKEPIIRRVDPADQPVVILSVKADLPPGEVYDLVTEKIKPRIEQVSQVGLVDILGGRQREIQVELDRDKLRRYELSASLVAQRLAGAGNDIPAGKKAQGDRETVFRTVGQFKSVSDMAAMVLNFFGNDVPVRIQDVGRISDTLADETTRAYVNGDRSLFLYVFRQSGSNTIRVVDNVKKAIEKLNADLKIEKGNPSIGLVRDGSVWIRNNVTDVYESIFIGIALAVVTVFLFLGSFRSTIITGLALPNSLIGAFLLMAVAGFSINIMTLLALSLSVGLLIDDAIVVRENIFRHMELGSRPVQAAREGTAEVQLAVIATTLAVIAVFGPLGFLKGVVGQFFKEFGLTVCFAMLISLFDALTMAPMLSAYFGGAAHGDNTKGIYGMTIGALLRLFEWLQDRLVDVYTALLIRVLKRPVVSLVLSFVVFIALMSLGKYVPKTFLPPQDAGEFTVGIDLPPGTNLDKMGSVSLEIDKIIRQNPEVEVAALSVGSREGEPNYAEFYIHLVPRKNRSVNTSEFKERLRGQLKPYASANPKVKDYDAVGGGMRPFNLNIAGANQAELERIGSLMLTKLKDYPGLKDVDITFRSGKPEFQVVPDKNRAQQLGVSTVAIGTELRAQIEGVVPAKYRENGIEYDVRVRMKEDQRDLRSSFGDVFVPNINQQLVRLANVSKAVDATGPSVITRQDRGRYVQIQADIAPGAGLGNILSDISKMMDSDAHLPPGYTYSFVGQAENFKELSESMVMAMGAGILFIFLVLASLYESFITPFTIMLALPLAICGAVVGLFVGGQSMNLFSMIGMIMLLGVAAKNSILLVDYANQLVHEGKERREAILTAGKTRLRPILMTTMALIAGTVPIAIGLNEASKQRTSMGWAIIGGLISSTLLTLIVVPAAYSYIDQFREWISKKLGRLLGVNAA